MAARTRTIKGAFIAGSESEQLIHSWFSDFNPLSTLRLNPDHATHPSRSLPLGFDARTGLHIYSATIYRPGEANRGRSNPITLSR